MAVFALRDIEAESARGPWGDVLAFAGALVEAREAAVRVAYVEDVGIFGIGLDVAALGAADGEAVVFADDAVIGAAGKRDCAAVLLRCVDVVGNFVVDSDVIELRGGLVVPGAPGGAMIDGDVDALIGRLDHAVGVGGI